MSGSIILVLLSLFLFIVSIPGACLKDGMDQASTIQPATSRKCYHDPNMFYDTRIFAVDRFCCAHCKNMSQLLERNRRSSTVQFSCNKQIGSLSEEKQRRNILPNSVVHEAPVACSRTRWWRCIALWIGNEDRTELHEACTISKDTIGLFLIPIVLCVLVYDYQTRRGANLAFNDAVMAPDVLSQMFFCNICMVHKPQEQSFRNRHCAHEFCCECIAKYVEIKLRENSARVKCMEMGCMAEINLESCQWILTKELLEKWSMILSESLILPDQKFYCPFKNCSALLWDDSKGREVIRKAECPYCWRLFCAQCKVGWHADRSCSEFQRVRKWVGGNDDAIMKDLANEKRWQRCPRCKAYVDKISGCLQITCRCGYQFCYRCGLPWTPKHYQCKLKRQTR